MSQSTCYYHYRFQEKQTLLSFILKECIQLCMVSHTKINLFHKIEQQSAFTGLNDA